MRIASRHPEKFCGGTNAGFRHGSDVPITRANIVATQQDRVKAREPKSSPAAIVYRLVSIPQQRHFRRAEKLMRTV